MTLQRSLRLALIWTALMAIVIYAVAAESLLVALLGLPSAWACWWASHQAWAPSVPRLLINAVLLIVVALGLGLASLDGEFNVERIAEMLASLLVIKLFDRRNARDAAEVLALSVFLVFGAILTSLKLSVGVFLLVFCPLLVWAALVQQVVATDERVEVYQDQIGASRLRTGPGGAMSRGLRRMTGALTISASLIAAAVFVLVPRGLAPSFLGDLGGARGSVTGYADTVELGRAGLISESQEKVLDLRVTDGDPTNPGNLGGAGRVFYLRGGVLDAYENGRWTRLRRRSGDYARLETDYLQRVQTGTIQTRAVIAQEISLRDPPNQGSMMFAIQEPFLWEFAEPLEFVSDSRLGTLRLEENAKTQNYVVYSGLPGARPMGDEVPAAMDPERLIDFPSDKVRELTAQLLEADGLSGERMPRSPGEIAGATRAIREHLQGFAYTLDILRAQGDPIEWFLFTRQEGHCEYFASAMAAMCRSVGINARVVTGYVAVEYNDATAQYTVRESNAHAWVEVEHAPGQWRAHDPTPPADLERVHSPGTSLASVARRWMDALEFFWVDSVVSFDRGSQRRVLGSDEPDDEPQIAVLESIAEFFRRARASGWVGVVQAVLAGAMAFTGVLVMTILAQSFFRRLGIGGGRGPRVRILGGTRDVGEFLLRTLDKAGHPKPGWKPLLAHVRDVPGGQEVGVEGFSDVVDRLYEARFGGRPLSAEEAQGLRHTIIEASGRLVVAASG